MSVADRLLFVYNKNENNEQTRRGIKMGIYLNPGNENFRRILYVYRVSCL